MNGNAYRDLFEVNRIIMAELDVSGDPMRYLSTRLNVVIMLKSSRCNPLLYKFISKFLFLLYTQKKKFSNITLRILSK